jgi:NAD(P)-dependent dehydrogenase (short-subunit alcohol dehydrogenase family)
MPRQILITGSSGLIGRAMTRALSAAGFSVRGYDPAAVSSLDKGDICDAQATRAAVDGVDGILHLGAVSRVVWAQRDPSRCQATNVEGTRNVLAAAASARTRPWVVVVSSREVYGQASSRPVAEDAPRRPRCSATTASASAAVDADDDTAASGAGAVAPTRSFASEARRNTFRSLLMPGARRRSASAARMSALVEEEESKGTWWEDMFAFHNCRHYDAINGTRPSELLSHQRI